MNCYKTNWARTYYSRMRKKNALEILERAGLYEDYLTSKYQNVGMYFRHRLDMCICQWRYEHIMTDDELNYQAKNAKLGYQHYIEGTK